MFATWSQDLALVDLSTESDARPAESSINALSSTPSQSLSSPLGTKPFQSLGAVRDRNNTLVKYQQALTELGTALKGTGKVPEKLKPTKFSGDTIPQAGTFLELQDQINEMMDAQEIALANPEGWEKVKQVMKTVFIATSPFAKAFLMLAKQHSIVSPFIFLF